MLASGQRRCQYATLAFGGMRSGDEQRLLVCDVDLEGDWLHIKSREGAETKTGESHKVPIHPVLKPLLTATTPKRRGRDGRFFCEAASRQYPNGDHEMNTKRLNEDFLTILQELGIPAGKNDGGFTIHSLRSFFKTFCINAGVPKEVVDIWQGHAPDRSASAGYYKLSDEQSQQFMKQVPFRTSDPAANAGNQGGA
jgi:integrase